MWSVFLARSICRGKTVLLSRNLNSSEGVANPEGNRSFLSKTSCWWEVTCQQGAHTWDRRGRRKRGPKQPPRTSGVHLRAKWKRDTPSAVKQPPSGWKEGSAFRVQSPETATWERTWGRKSAGVAATNLASLFLSRYPHINSGHT